MTGPGSRRWWPAVVAIAVLMGVLSVLVLPWHADGVIGIVTARLPLPIALRSDAFWALEDLGNAGLFVPVGLVLTLATGRALPGSVLGALLSACCELVQTWVPGRDPSLLDVCCNVVGAVTGAVVARGLLRRGVLRRGVRRRQAT